MSKNEILTHFGLAFHPFRPDVPLEGLWQPPLVGAFVRRVELTIADGGFAMVTGEPGTGKSVALRLLSERLSSIRDVKVGCIDHPQSRCADFYRELGDLFGVSLQNHNRWGGFKALRQRWAEHVSGTLTRPVLIIDEAQEMVATVMNELRILSSKNFDSEQLLCVIFAGDNRLLDRFRQPELRPLGSRIRRRLHLDYADRDLLNSCLDHLLKAAGNVTLMTTELRATLAEHSAGNFRVMMNLSDELMTLGFEAGVSQLDEQLFLEVFHPDQVTPQPVKKPAKRPRRSR